MGTTRKILFFSFILLAIAGGTLFMYQAIQTNRTNLESATVWPAPKPLPQLNLVDQSGRPFTQANLEGKWSLLFFGFTHCPDICPATLQQLAIANVTIGESGQETPDIIFVSVDPERDLPETMAAYVKNFGDKIQGVTGDIVEIQNLTSAAGVFFAKAELPNGEYSVDHSAVVLVVNEDAEIFASFSAPHTVNSFVHDLPFLMDL